MYKYLLSIFLLLLILPITTLALDYDLSLVNSDISFSTDNLIVGQQIRLYARVRNIGTKDMRGYVTFFQGDKVIGDSQQVAVRGSNYADAWVDFQVPNGTFNILAKVQGTQPADQNQSNDQALTSTFDVDIDTDGDGIGNNIDTDDDNDGLSDAQEANLGTDPQKKDTDGDGVNDGEDYYPLDSTKSRKPEIKTESNKIIKQVVSPPDNQEVKQNNDSNSDQPVENKVVEKRSYWKDLFLDDSTLKVDDQRINSNIKPLTILGVIKSWYFWSLLAIMILVIFLWYYYRKTDWQFNRITPRLVKDEDKGEEEQKSKIIDLRNIKK